MLTVYNTLTKEKEIFTPQNKDEVTMYVCGPTVYDDIHIGNARSMVAFDTIRRYLEYRGYQVKYVSNFTDVDDKIIKRAKELNKTPKELADYYIKSVKEDMETLNIKAAYQNPQATNYIAAMIKMIETLLAKNHAYVASNGDVYFRTRSFAEYGKLSHQKIDELENGASNRLDDNSQYKEDPLDFALWKHAKDGEVQWETSFGSGRPGWHLECSAMVNEIFDGTIDIHGGGQDLTFPHHENEIAQSECVSDHHFARYWLHNGYVTVGDNEKMSKSLGNFTTLKKLATQVEADVIRFFMATTHYRRPLQFNENSLKEAQTNLNKIKEAYQNADFRLQTSVAGADTVATEVIKQFEQQFIVMMDDDFNASNALTVIYDFVKWINDYTRQEEVHEQILQLIKQTLAQMLEVFGVALNDHEVISDQAILDLIEKRNQARSNKDYVLSDQIRDDLKAQGILLEDTAQGTKYKRIVE